MTGTRAIWGLITTAVAVLAALPASASATTLPPGFTEDQAFAGLTVPTAVELAPDGRVFVAEKSGMIKAFSGPGDPTAEVVADLRTQTYNVGDRGMLDIALDPEFPDSPYLYALYALDAEIGEVPPTWGTAGSTWDACPHWPEDGCVIGGRLTRMKLTESSAGPEQILLEDWCQQYSSHSTGAIAFDSEGALIASGGDGASFNFVDYGQTGQPLNPCGDPPSGRGGTQTPPTAEGGALRSQDLRTSADPAGLNGSIVRVDRTDGSPLPDNPNFSDPDPNARRIIGYGMRNPFRLTVRPGTDEIWFGDVGWGAYEEVNRQSTDELVNHGWPCYEGAARQPGYDGADLDICEDLYSEPAADREPYFTYGHKSKVVPGESCAAGSNSISGITFYGSGGSFPGAYDDALFFSDYSRACIWAMKAGPGGDPDPSTVETFAAGAQTPVGLEVGDDGALYYPDIAGGRIMKISYSATNQPPAAELAANPTSGSAPLTVELDASGSTDPDPGAALSFAWDLDDDGDFDDGTGAELTHELTEPGSHRVSVEVSDELGASDRASTVIDVDNEPPVPSIDSPAADLRWAVGDRIDFSGSASDAQDGDLPPSALDWEVVLHHCPGTCHAHPEFDFPATASGSFLTPSHEYPSYLELKLTATDSHGLSASTSVELDPETAKLMLESAPSSAGVSLNADGGPAPLEAEVIAGSAASISAEERIRIGGKDYAFERWKHGGARVQTLTADGDATYRAIYRRVFETPRTLRFEPVADASIYAGDPGGNRGGLDTVEVDGDPFKDFLLRFDVSGIDGDLVRSAKLRLHAVNGSDQGGRFHATGNDWQEGSVTSSNAPPAGELLGSLGRVDIGSWYEINVGSHVDGDGTFSFRVDSDFWNGADYSSREGPPELQPELVVEAGEEPGPIKLAASGDIACDPGDASFNGGQGTTDACRQGQVSDMLLGRGLDAVLPLGDLQYEEGTLEKFEASYEPSWGRLDAIVRPVPGNHEYMTPDAEGYYDYFNGVGQASGRAGDRDKGYYSYDLGGWHVVALNTNCAEVGGCGPGSAQEAWLRADLTANAGSCLLAYTHSPLFSSGSRGGAAETRPLWDALYEAGAEAVLSGHEHHYERFARQAPDGSPDPAAGIRQFVVGSGGKRIRPIGDRLAPNSGARDDQRFGALELTLRSDRYEWSFLDESGRDRDSGSQPCSGPISDAEPPSAPGGVQGSEDVDGDVELDWQPSTDDDGVSEYAIYRDGNEVGTSITPGYEDSGAVPGTDHSYRVAARDPSGNESNRSDAFEVTMSGDPPPDPNHAPTADLLAEPTSGKAPLTVDLDASGSTDPDPGDVLSYAWDLDADGKFDDATGSRTSHEFIEPGSHRVEVEVSDQVGASDGASVVIDVDGDPPPDPDPEPPPPKPQTLTFGASDDASIYAEQPATNFGAAGSLEVDEVARKHFLIKFDVGGLDGQSVTSATLKLHAVNGSPGRGGIFAPVANGWSEGSVNWSNAPAGGAPFTALGPVAVGGDYEVDVSSVVDDAGSFSFRVGSDNANGADYSSSEGPGSLAPKLVVETEPAPTPPPDTLTFNADADASLYADAPNQRFGGAGSLETDAQADKDFLLRFAVDGVGGRRVSDATLRLHAVNPSPTGGHFHVASPAFSESQVSWATAPPLQGSPVDSLGAVSVGNWYDVKVGSVVDGDGSYAFRIDSDDPNGADFASREVGPFLAPQLVVELDDSSLASATLAARGAKARVARVIDARTVRVRLPGGGREKVRMPGLRRPKSRCLARRAKRSLGRALDRRKRVRLLTDSRAPERDRRGRLVRYVERAGKDPARRLLRRGLLRPAGKRKFERHEEYRSLAKAAKRKRRSGPRRCRR